jgi:hypothetical protein
LLVGEDDKAGTLPEVAKVKGASSASTLKISGGPDRSSSTRALGPAR